MSEYKSRVEYYFDVKSNEVNRLADIIYDCIKYADENGLDFDSELRLARDYQDAED